MKTDHVLSGALATVVALIGMLTMLPAFAAPGEADLTALVDFATIARVAQSRDGRHLGTVTQGDWLRALGLDARAEALMVRAPHLREEILLARDRLANDDQMGQLFKVMGLAAPLWPDGAGFPVPGSTA